MSQYNTITISGLKNLLKHIKENTHIVEPLNQMMSFFPSFNEQLDGIPFTQSVPTWISWQYKLHTVIVYEGKQIIGFGQLRLHKNTAELMIIIVMEKHRKKNVGSYILLKLEDIAVNTGKKNKLMLWCEKPTKYFYKKHGFLDQKCTPMSDHGHTLYRMSKEIDKKIPNKMDRRSSLSTKHRKTTTMTSIQPNETKKCQL